ncbi:hypothetical protein MPSEU_000838300 [Mayamaea pseudoterrestris]|nr:hypothetical protein MPSEU_000838300 [Mayamaea pseudoterrestris]
MVSVKTDSSLAQRQSISKLSSSSSSSSFLEEIITWIGHEGSHHAKHRGLLHPITTLLLHYAIIISVTFVSHDFLLHRISKVDAASCTFGSLHAHRAHNIAMFCFCYSVWLLAWRLYFFTPVQYRSAVVYEFCWLCNVSLIVGGLGLLTSKPVVAQAYCVTVGIDQLLWYVDLSVYLVRRKFPIGVAKYIFWEGTSWTTRITCWHHVWTLPLLLWGAQGMHPIAFVLSAIVMVANVCVARCTTPFDLHDNEHKLDDKVEPKYLNVNLSHELWRDIKFKFLQINYDDPPVGLYLFRLLWRWECFNLMVFMVLYGLCRAIFGNAPVC